MPSKLPTRCRNHHKGCPALTTNKNGWCDEHQPIAFSLFGERKKTEHRRLYNTPAWRKLRLAVLAEDPLCAECLKGGLTVGATDVDHIIDLANAPELALVRANLQSLCHPCHSKKTISKMAL
jgi:5-methylcytosine-specific restriction protein A